MNFDSPSLALHSSILLIQNIGSSKSKTVSYPHQTSKLSWFYALNVSLQHHFLLQFVSSLDSTSRAIPFTRCPSHLSSDDIYFSFPHTCGLLSVRNLRGKNYSSNPLQSKTLYFLMIEVSINQYLQNSSSPNLNSCYYFTMITNTINIYFSPVDWI